jgi:hypothetical protein
MDISVASNFERALFHAAEASTGSREEACGVVKALQAGLVASGGGALVAALVVALALELALEQALLATPSPHPFWLPCVRGTPPPPPRMMTSMLL